MLYSIHGFNLTVFILFFWMLYHIYDSTLTVWNYKIWNFGDACIIDDFYFDYQSIFMLKSSLKMKIMIWLINYNIEWYVFASLWHIINELLKIKINFK